jgi:mRNA-degrading endonuclease RelE of RelBE toxin-antitoxin system
LTSHLAKYSIQFTEDAKKDVEALDGSIKRQLRKVLEKKLAAHPEQYGQPLGGVLTGYWSHHFAAQRIIYRIYPDQEPPLVVICAVGPRRGVHKHDFYRRFESLVQAGKVADQVLRLLEARKPKKKS